MVGEAGRYGMRLYSYIVEYFFHNEQKPAIFHYSKCITYYVGLFDEEEKGQ